MGEVDEVDEDWRLVIDKETGDELVDEVVELRVEVRLGIRLELEVELKLRLGFKLDDGVDESDKLVTLDGITKVGRWLLVDSGPELFFEFKIVGVGVIMPVFDGKSPIWNRMLTAFALIPSKYSRLLKKVPVVDAIVSMLVIVARREGSIDAVTVHLLVEYHGQSVSVWHWYKDGQQVA